MLVDTYRCMNKGWLPRKGHCLSLLVNGALLLCGVVTSMRQRGKWHIACVFSCCLVLSFFFDICCLVLSFYHPLTDQFYFPVLFCWIDVDRCL